MKYFLGYSKKVMIVSPMSLFPMLQITVKALHNLKVERSIADILKNVDKLSEAEQKKCQRCSQNGGPFLIIILTK